MGEVAIDVPAITQIITAATALIAAISTAAVLIIKELRSISVKADAVAEDQNKKLDVIHENGNAHLALMTDKLAASEAKNEKLLTDVNNSFERRIQDLADRLEASHAAASAAPPPALGPVKVQIEQPEGERVPVVLPKSEAGPPFRP